DSDSDEEEQRNDPQDVTPPVPPPNDDGNGEDAPEEEEEEEDEIVPPGPSTDNRPIAERRQPRSHKPPGEWWKVPRNPTPVIPDDTSDEEEEDEAAQAISDQAEPVTYRQAITSPNAEQWQEAMIEEMTAHLSNGTWNLVELPPGQKAIGSKWVYRIKHKADGSIERFKARLVAKGFSQRLGFDYSETFASTMRQNTLRTVLALAAVEDLHLRSIDISHAFINSDIDTEIYMTQPEGFRQGGPRIVCRLDKSLYGLKQAPRLWDEKLGIYIYQNDNVKVIVPVFVDDITLASKSEDMLDEFVAKLSKHFKLRDLGATSYLLGVEITRNRPERKLYLSQRQYIINKLEEFGMTDCKPATTPMTPNLILSKSQSPQTPDEVEEMSEIPYISAVGSLLYLATMTRPDIAYTASVLARFNSNPGMDHWKAVKHVLRYLKGTMDIKLEYGPDPTTNDLFVTYCDSDLGGNRDNGKSTTGYILKLGSGAVSWSSKLQPMVTLSSTEAEYIAAVAAGKEIKAMRNLLEELGYQSQQPAKLLIDNQSTIKVAKNPEHHGRMKHLDRHYFWLRDKVVERVITPEYLPTDANIADLLTKALGRPKVVEFRKGMGLVL
ncbi:hypothetical protein MPER_12841, partial [Moniliophthora perniciosa FA553]